MIKIIYNENKFLNNLTRQEFKTLKALIIQDTAYFIDDLEVLNKSLISGNIKDKMFNIYGLSLIENVFREIKEIDVFDNFVNHIENEMDVIIKSIEKHMMDTIEDNIKPYLRRYKTLFSKKLKKSIFKFFLWNIKGDFLLKVDELYFHQLLIVTRNVKGVIYNRTNLDVESIKIDFGIKLIKSSNFKIGLIEKEKKELTLKNDFNFYNMNYHIKEDTINYNNKYLVDLRIMFDREDFHPNINFITEYMNVNIPKNSIVNIICPFFLETKSSVLLAKNHGYFNIYYVYPEFYKKLINEIVKLSNDYQLSVVVPNKINYTSYLKWYVLIKDICNTLEIKPVDVGVLFDDFYIQYDIEYYGKSDFVIMDFDELAYNLTEDYRDVSIEDFTEEFVSLLRMSHGYFRDENIEHTIYSKYIKNKEVIEKLMKLGYTNFIYPDINTDVLSRTINNYMGRRGKYVGLTKIKGNKTTKISCNTCN